MAGSGTPIAANRENMGAAQIKSGERRAPFSPCDSPPEGMDSFSNIPPNRVGLTLAARFLLPIKGQEEGVNP